MHPMPRQNDCESGTIVYFRVKYEKRSNVKIISRCNTSFDKTVL